MQQAGDALLIPEGWWHQVDSQAGTLAVNFWWSPQPGKPPLPAPYLLRRTLQAMTEARMAAELGLLKRRPAPTQAHQVPELAKLRSTALPKPNACNVAQAAT